MKRKISVICIAREMDASEHGFFTNTEVRIYRGEAGKDFTGTHHNTIQDYARRGTISAASVIRAKRAQLALTERAQSLS